MNRVAIETHPILYRILSKGDLIDTFEFSDLHVAIFNLNSTETFADTLAVTPREAINNVDYTGRTALSRAAELGEYEMVKMLLIKGADPNISDTRGRSALYWCADKIDCLTLLLDAGAQVNQRANSYLDTKVMHLIRNSDPSGGVDCLDLLWKRGACLDRLPGSLGAPIHNCVEYYRPKILKWLLEKPIDLDAKTDHGMKMLQDFLDSDVGKHSDMLEMVLDSQPDYHAINNMGEGLCHSMARFGSLAFL